MEISNINLVYFSATNTTKKITKLIAGQVSGNITTFNITQKAPDSDVISGSRDLFIVGVPVYAGRIPAKALEGLNKFKGNDTPAIIVCVYGNRDYDDALLELRDVVETNGYKVISAGAFIAQHAIFPQVGAGRPDEQDIILIKKFADESLDIIRSTNDVTSLPDVTPKGNKPYEVPGELPIHPKGDKKCNECGTCVVQCPVHAIPENNPRKTDKKECIVCARCIIVCPQCSRHFGGILYKLAGKKFIKAYSARKEPETIFG
ncbi:MAG: 4Fe-4S ferredoxin [Tannerella sp.]|jgi:ferredoxin|nr:4Fe-4S ferredoxin [Tannerella sp.]